MIALVCLVRDHPPRGWRRRDTDGLCQPGHNGAQIIEPHDKVIANAIQQKLHPWPGILISAQALSAMHGRSLSLFRKLALPLFILIAD
jgi:hypothetical protein